MERILVATDGSAAAREAIRFALELAHENEASVTFVHAVPQHDWVPGASFVPVAAIPHEPTAEDEAPLKQAEWLALEHDVVCDSRLVPGEPADVIAECADLVDADLIVVGSRGRGAVTGALLGSVSRRLLRESTRPVLVVRAPAKPPAPAPSRMRVAV